MSRITVARALDFAEDHFPNAPEKLAEFLGVEVRRSPLNCDGWCLQIGEHSIIRINSDAADVRQRFTLAHELGHLVFGIPAVVGEAIIDVHPSANEEEKMVNSFAAQLLLPKKIAEKFIPEIPVTATVIKRISKKAKVSEVFVARRLASLAQTLGLKDALVIFYKNNTFEWQWSNTIGLKLGLDQEILKRCLNASPSPARIHRKEYKDAIVASILENPYSDTTIIFLQIVPEEDGLKKLNEETIRELSEFIFGNNQQFQLSLQGCFGVFKSKVRNLSTAEALKLFNKTYLEANQRWEQAELGRLKSEKGQKYIRLRLENWTKK